jgi:hypothetical protein
MWVARAGIDLLPRTILTNYFFVKASERSNFALRIDLERIYSGIRAGERESSSGQGETRD